MSAVVAGNLLALAGTAKPLPGKRGRSATRTRRVVSAAANGEYRVLLPALQSAQPVPLLKYITSP